VSVVAVAIGGSAIVGAVASSGAADDASQAQRDAAGSDIAFRMQQQAEVRKLLQPYVEAGSGRFNSQQYLAANPDVAADPTYSQDPEGHWVRFGQHEGRADPGRTGGALYAQQDLLGLNGGDRQRAAYAGIEASPAFQALVQQGENGILQNASATGGLRGGNTQGALAQFRPQMLAQLIEQQYSRLGGLTQLGQNSAAGVGSAALSTANGVGNALQQQGAATAGGYLAQGAAVNQALGGVGQAFGYANTQGRFGGTPSGGSFGGGGLMTDLQSYGVF
jgi:hypothetical protein